MKLRNKKTGEIVESIVEAANRLNNGKNTYTLAELNEEWEDYEEPKWNWYIDWDGEIKQCDNRVDALLKFETKEEAEKAVEKLKAWKRLKDKGFRFTGWDRHPDFDGDFRITASDDWNCDDKDLDLLFGGEE